jgi:hypothetical protein
MKKIILLLLCVCFSLFVNSQTISRTVNISAGGLASALTFSEKTTITNLTITGTIDARDFVVMRDTMIKLQYLDISNVAIASYTGKLGSFHTHDSVETYNANTIPQYAFYADEWTNHYTFILPASVENIGEAAFQNNFLSSVSFAKPSSLKYIGKKAFFHCPYIDSISIPSSVTTIGYYSFAECTILKNVNIESQSNLKTIDTLAFTEDENLLSISIPSTVNSINFGAFFQCQKLHTVTIDTPSSLTSIDWGVFFGCWALTSFTIPPTVTSINESAFQTSGLTSIIIPPSVTEIGKVAFGNCMDLVSVTLPNGLKRINDQTFGGCSSLKSLNIPASVTYIGNYAFTGVGFDTFTIPSTIDSIGIFAFSNSTLTSVTIPATLKYLGRYAFQYCYTLKKATFTGLAQLSKIENGTFMLCAKLDSLILPSTITSIGDSAFYRCFVLKTITLPSSTTTIKIAAFSGCEALKTITIPSSVTNMGMFAFDQCIALTSITFENNGLGTTLSSMDFSGCTKLSSIINKAPIAPNLNSDYSMFYDVNNLTCALYVPFGSKKSYQTTSPWSRFKIIIEGNNNWYSDTTLTFTNDSSSKQISITSQATWIAHSDEPWLTVNPDTSISGNAKLTITAKKNTGSARTANVIITTNGKNDTIKVKQTIFVTLSNNTVLLAKDSNSTSYDTVYSNTSAWTATPSVPWLTIKTINSFNPMTMTMVQYLVISSTKNQNIASRTATITVSALGIDPQIITVTQAASDTIFTVSNSIVSLTGMNNSTSIGITSNINWIASSNQAWLTVTNDSTNLLLAALANPTTTSRNAIVKVTAGSKTITIMVSQAAGEPVITVPTTTVSITNMATATPVTITSNTTWDVISDVSWLTITPANGNGDGTISILPSANPTTLARTATVTITSLDGTTKTFEVSQIGTDPIITTAKSTISFIDTVNTDSVIITSNGPWSASSDVSWLTISPATGQGNDTIIITAEPNTTGITRSATVTITSDATVTLKGASFQTITVTQEATTASNIETADNIILYPNPAQSSFSVNTNGKTGVEIYSLNSERIFNTIVTGNEPISLYEISNGIYFVKITTDKKTIVKRLVVDK